MCKFFFSLPASRRCFLRSLFQAIQDILGKLKAHPKEEIIKMLDASRVGCDSGGTGRPPLSRALKIERDCLLRLGTSLGRCAEKMVRLALLDAQRMASTRPSMSRHEYIHQWAYFIGALTPAIDHTKMETRVSSGASRAFLPYVQNCVCRTNHTPKNLNPYCNSKRLYT